jgi:hypothetical protein
VPALLMARNKRATLDAGPVQPFPQGFGRASYDTARDGSGNAFPVLIGFAAADLHQQLGVGSSMSRVSSATKAA